MFFQRLEKVLFDKTWNQDNTASTHKRTEAKKVKFYLNIPFFWWNNLVWFGLTPNFRCLTATFSWKSYHDVHETFIFTSFFEDGCGEWHIKSYCNNFWSRNYIKLIKNMYVNAFHKLHNTIVYMNYVSPNIRWGTNINSSFAKTISII